MSTLLIAALSLVGPSNAPVVTIKVRPTAVAAVRKAAAKFGAVESAADGTLSLRVKDANSAHRALVAMLKIRDVESAWSSNEPRRPAPLTGEIQAITKEIARLTDPDAAEEEREARKRGEIPKENGDEPDYLRALLYYLTPRAYPYNRVDWDAYDRATDHAQVMRPYAPTTTKTTQARSLAKATVATPAAVVGKWVYVGPNNLNTPYRVYYGFRPSSGRIGGNGLAYDPRNNGTLWLTGASGGVHKSKDNGATWTALGDKWAVTACGPIVVDPKNPDTVYVGLGDYHGGVGNSGGIMKTTDGGATWTNFGKSNFGTVDVSGIIVDPENPQIVVVTTGHGRDGNGLVWRSTNGGQTWTQVISTFAQWSGASMSAATSGKRSYWAVGGSNVYRSDDRGATWTKVSPSGLPNDSGATLSIAASQVSQTTAFLLSPSDQKIYKTTDAGSTWTDITGNFPGDYNWSQAWYDYHITAGAKSGKDDVFVGLIDVVESVDGTASWKSVGQTYTDGALTHNDQHALAVNPANPDDILIGNDGGIYRGVRSGTTWSIAGLSANLGITMFYNAVFHPTDLTRLVGGTQDNASPVALGDLSKWENVAGGDGGFCAINPANPAIQYATVYGASVYQTKDNWATERVISPNIGTDNSPFVTPIWQDPVNTNYLYCCTNWLYRYDLSTNSWTNHLGGTALSNSLIHVVSVAPNNGNVLYTGSDDGQLWKSTTKGTSFARLNGSGTNLPNRSITSISVNPTDANDIIVGLSGTGTGHLFRATNTTSATPSFTNISGTGTSALPDVPLNCIERDRTAPQTKWYVGTDLGVFVTEDAGKTWQNMGSPLGLPIVPVNSLAMGTHGFLQAATYGRGVWKFQAGEVPGDQTFTVGNPVAAGGTITGGSRASILAADTQQITVRSSYQAALGQVGGISVPLTNPTANGKIASATITVKVTAPSLTTIQVFLQSGSTSEQLKATPANGTAQTLSFNLTAAQITKYLSTGTMNVIIRAVKPTRLSSDLFTMSVDYVGGSLTYTVSP